MDHIFSKWTCNTILLNSTLPFLPHILQSKKLSRYKAQSFPYSVNNCAHPYQNIRSLVYISRKYAANLQHVCGLYLRRVCRKRVFRMQITFLAHCSDTQCAPQVCSAQLSRTVLAHNVRRKFAAHSCRTLYWHTMCAASMLRTVVAHYSGTQCAPYR